MIKIAFYISLVVHTILYLSCNGSKNNSETVSMNHVEGIDSLKSQVLIHGDTSSYERLRIHFLESSQYEQLGFSLLMANKYKYTPAFMDVVLALKEWNQVDISRDSVDLTSVDRASRIMILKYLILADKNSYEDASYELKWLKSTKLYVDDIREAELQANNFYK